MDKILGGIFVTGGFLVLLAVIATLVAFPTMWAANYLFAPTFLTFVFGAAKLNFWRALVLNFIAGWLLRSNSSSSKD